jgi:GAF domain-containing protein
MKKRITIAASVRYGMVVLALVAYVWLLRFDAQYTFPETLHRHTSFIVSLTEFGFSALVAFLFLAVGALVMLYVRQRLVGFLLFAFSCSMMMTFALESAAVLNLPGPSLATDLSSSLSVSLLVILLLVFPHNYLTRQPGSSRRWGIGVAHAYLALLTALLVFYFTTDPLLLGLIAHGHPIPPPAIHAPDTGLLEVFGLSGCFGSLLMTFLRPSSPRERQQVRILAIGMLLAFVPFLALTVLPAVIAGESSPYALPGEISTVTMGLMPVAIGYAILRYHVLIVDRHIRSAVTLLVGGLCLAVAAYLAFFTSSILLPGNWAQVKWCIAVIFLLLVPATWNIAPRVTGRIFAPDLASVHHLLYGQREAADLLNTDDSALEAVARQIMQAARTIFGTQRLCFFVYHKESGFYHLVKPAWVEAGDDTCARTLFSTLGQGDRAQQQQWLDAREPIFARLASPSRPLYLSQARFPQRTRRALGAPRWLASPAMQEDPLLVPVMARERPGGSEMMGVLLLGSRDNCLPYAGPDFELIDLLLLRFSWILGKALAEAQSQEHLTMLKALYGATSTALTSTQVTDEIARSYADTAASAMNVGAEVWLYDSQAQLLHRVAQAGDGPHLPYGERLQPREASDWLSWFYEGAVELWTAEQERTRPLILEPPTFPFAWLPLVRGDHLLGVLVLTHQPPHRHFSPAERQVLEIFAHQLAGSLENARVSSMLRAATSAQHDQDRLKSLVMKGRLQGLLQPLISLERYTAMLGQLNLTSSPGADTAMPHLQVELPHQQVPASCPPLEGLDALVASIGASLAQLHALATAPPGEPSTVTPLGSLFKREVNAILSGFDDTEGDPLVLVIAPDPDFRALLRTTLDLYGYTYADMATGRQAVEWLKGNRDSGGGPAAILLHRAALGGRPLGDLTREMQRATEAKFPFPPLLLLGGSDHALAQDQASFIPLELPFSVHSLVEHVQACLPRRSSHDD